MDENDPTPAPEAGAACPGCGGRGHYRLTPVGDVLCPECGGSGRRPDPMGGRSE